MPRAYRAGLDSPPAMDLYEYQGKELFSRYGIPVSDGRLATSAEEARRAAEELGGPVVVKAQVLTGGRGKAGGVKLAAGPDEAAEHAAAILGLDIRGHVVRRLWVERASGIRTSPRCAIPPPRIRWRRSRVRRASRTCVSTARSASSATVPASRWRPSTSSSSQAGGPPTSATSAAAGEPRVSSRLSR